MEEFSEAHLSTAQSAAQENPRVPQADGYAPWAGCPEAPSRQGPEALDRLDASRSPELGNGMAKSGRGLDPKERLKRRSDFQVIYQKGRAIHGRYQVLFYLMGERIERQVGFVASRRVGQATRRNRAKRVLREAYRHLRPELVPDVRLIFVARPECAEVASSEVLSEARRLLGAAGLLKEAGTSAS